MDLASYDYRDPGQLLRDVAAQHTLRDGDVLIALVREPSTEQRLIRFVRLDLDEWRPLDRHERTELMRQMTEQLAVPLRMSDDAPWHSFTTIVVRYGLTVFGSFEGELLDAWRYSNHCSGAFSGGLILVTEHGWCDLMTDLGGHQPSLVA